MGFFKNVFYFVRSPSHSRTTAVIVLFLIFSAIPLTVIISQQQQQLRQRAEGNQYSCIAKFYRSSNGCFGDITDTKDFNSPTDQSQECGLNRVQVSCLLINPSDNASLTPTSTPVPSTATTPTAGPTPTPLATRPTPTCAPQPSNCQQFLCTRTFFTDACQTLDPKFCPFNFCSPTDQTSDRCLVGTKTTCVGTATPTPTPTPIPQLIQCDIDTDEGQFRCRPNCFLGEIIVQGVSTTCNRGTETTCCLNRSKRLPTPTPIPSATCNNSSNPDNDCFKRFGTFCAVGASCIQNPNNPQKDCICKSTTPAETPTPIPACPFKPKGDADCNKAINIVDFNVWRDEFTGKLTTKTADFNNDGSIDIQDFNIWRDGFIAENAKK